MVLLCAIDLLQALHGCDRWVHLPKSCYENWFRVQLELHVDTTWSIFADPPNTWHYQWLNFNYDIEYIRIPTWCSTNLRHSWVQLTVSSDLSSGSDTAKLHNSWTTGPGQTPKDPASQLLVRSRSPAGGKPCSQHNAHHCQCRCRGTCAACVKAMALACQASPPSRKHPSQAPMGS